MLVGREPVPVHLVYARSQRLRRDVQLLSIVRIDRDLAVVSTLLPAAFVTVTLLKAGSTFLCEP